MLRWWGWGYPFFGSGELLSLDALFFVGHGG